jgi:uncharacterized protein (DUF1499 family)
MGLLTGKRPSKLGYNDGAFVRDTHPAAWKPNWVSSTVKESDKHYVAPLAFTGDAKAAWERLKTSVEALPRTKVIAADAQHLHAESTSPTLGFGDDLECALDAKAHCIHVRAGARLGVRDFDANRKRVEALRRAFSKA